MVAESRSLWVGEESHGKVYCWLQGDGPRGHEGEDCSGQCLWKKPRQWWSQGNTSESLTGWSHHQSLSPSIFQHMQLTKDPREGGPLSAWRSKQQRRTFEYQMPGARKDSTRAIVPAPKAAGAPTHLALPELPTTQATVPPPCSILTGPRVSEARKNPKGPTSPVPVVTRSPLYLALPGSCYQAFGSPPYLVLSGQTQVLRDKLLWITHMRLLFSC